MVFETSARLGARVYRFAPEPRCCDWLRVLARPLPSPKSGSWVFLQSPGNGSAIAHETHCETTAVIFCLGASDAFWLPVRSVCDIKIERFELAGLKIAITCAS